MKKEEGLIKRLDRYLASLPSSDNDRAFDVNAPSAAGDCNRANYYKRRGVRTDSPIAPRLRRIFDNGSHVHDRLQKYMMEAGILLIPELPVIYDPLNIQGHSDGLITYEEELAILEIKSINDSLFNKLVDAKADHKIQGSVYLFSTENRRENLRMLYPTLEAFQASAKQRAEHYERHYQHFVDGRRFSREEKIKMQVDLNMRTDEILWKCNTPIRKVVFLYENKNDQELKEYVLVWNDNIMRQIEEAYTALNYHILNGVPPAREGKNKSDSFCRYCGFRIECWG